MRKILLFLIIIAMSIGVYAQTQPTGTPDTLYVCPGNYVLNVLSNDFDLDEDSIYLAGFSNTSTLTLSKKDDSIAVTVPQNFTGAYTGSYEVCDTTGMCASVTFSIVLDTGCTAPTPPNRAPSANPDFFTGIEDLNILLRPTLNDTDPDSDPLTWTALTQPLNGSIIQSGGNYFYRGNPNYNGIDLFLYRACDPSNRCATSIVTIVISPINDQPDAYNDTFYIKEDQIVNANALANDIDVDGDRLRGNVTQQPFNGTVTMDIDGNFTYIPTKNYFGRDEFRYRACDTSRFFNCSTARVLFYIEPVNDAPEIEDITITVQNGGGTFEEQIVAKDAERNTMYYYQASNPNDSLISVTIDEESGKTIVVLPSTFCGTDSFLFKVCDSLICDTATFYIIAPKCVYPVTLTEGFSPNGDGINDKLVFDHLGDYLPAYLVVFNRNGNPIYESEDYQNDWDGRSMQNNEPLPDGTYYYTLELSKGGGKHANFLVINR